MQKKSLFLLTILLCMIFTSSLVFAQIEENLERYTEGNAVGYIKPLVNGIGANMNRGWYHSAKIPKNGIRLRIGLVAMIAPFMDKDKTFEAETEGTFTPQQTAEASTVVGSEKSVSVNGTGGTTYIFSGGLDMNAIPFAAPQITVGAIMGTEATLRLFNSSWLNMGGDSEMGDISLFGIGVRHNINQYIPLCPVDIAAGVFYQKISVGGDLLKFTTLHMGVQTSKGLGPILLYGGIGFDNSNAKLEYEYNGEYGKYGVSMDVDGDNGVLMTVGLGFNFLILHLNADASFGIRTVYSAGLNFGI